MGGDNGGVGKFKIFFSLKRSQSLLRSPLPWRHLLAHATDAAGDCRNDYERRSLGD